MGATHIEFASDVAATTCPDCSRDTVKEALLVNRNGLVLARGAGCVRCSHTRHRASHHRQNDVQATVYRVREARIA
jgi:hypothetical protein